MVGRLAHSGRVIFAAGAVMVAGFLTFALSGPLPLKEIEIIVGIAVLLDAARAADARAIRASPAGPPGGCRGGSTALPDVRFGH
jgi:RND superfamily putative drug exporter